MKLLPTKMSEVTRQPNMKDSKYYPEKSSRAWAEVDLDALGKNLALVREKLAPEVRVMGVIKADAYGHGARVVARELIEHGVQYLGVATVEEGIDLRKAAVAAPLAILPGICNSACAEAVRWNLRPALYRRSQAVFFSKTAKKIGRPLKVHIKIDTGMNRIGISPEEVPNFIKEIRRLPFLEVEGAFTHFPMVGPEEEKTTLKQNTAFLQAVSNIENTGLLHASNSSATLLK